MKSAATLFPFFFLFAFISPTLADEVVDTDGNKLRNGGTYYILPAGGGTTGGGGIERMATGEERCPLTVVQSPSEHSNGLPITIRGKGRMIHVYQGQALQLWFDSPADPACGAPESSTWTIVKGGSQGLPSVKLAGSEAASGKYKIGAFNIERAGLGYKLVYCYHYSHERRCSHIGIHVDDDGNRRLVASIKEAPFVVQFKRASSSTH